MSSAFFSACLAAVVALSGGFRVHLGAIRIGVTTPWPLLLWSLGVGVVRHVVAPQQPLYREFPVSAGGLGTRAGVRVAVAALAGTRPIILFVGYLAVFMFGYAEGHAPLRHFTNELLNLPVRWDAGWYLQIVTDGYQYSPLDTTTQQNIVFFPAYPMLVRIVGRILGGHMIGYVVGRHGWSPSRRSSAVLSCTFTPSRATRSMTTARAPRRGCSRRIHSRCSSAPSTPNRCSCSARSAPSTISRSGDYGRAALWGLLVGLTRLNGSLLMLPLAVLAIQSRPSPPRIVTGWPPWHRGPIAGLAIYVAFVWPATGDPLAFLSGQLAWGRQLPRPWRPGLSAVFHHREGRSERLRRHARLRRPERASARCSRSRPSTRSRGVWDWPTPCSWRVNILPALANGGLLSAGRFSSVLFPAFIWLAAVVPSTHRPAWIASFAALQAYNAALFYTWRPLF